MVSCSGAIGLALVALTLGGGACTGRIGEPVRGATGSGGLGGGGQTGGAAGAGGAAGGGGGPAKPEAGPRPLRRLTRHEYNNTVRDLIGDDTEPANRLPDDVEGASGFLIAGTVSTLDAEAIMEVAEAVAARATTRLAEILTCAPTDRASEDACASDFAARFGRRAYRRPLTASENADLVAYYRSVRGTPGYGFTDAIRMLIQLMLQSPSFLYHWEVGAGAPAVEGDLVRLGPHELASRLSYFLWKSMPDERLFRAADAGVLRGQADVEAEARRLLADPKAKDTIEGFHFELLDLQRLADVQKDRVRYPFYDQDLAVVMQQETRAFVTWAVLGGGGGRLETLLTSSVGFVDERLAGVYGLVGVAGQDLRRVDLDPAQRAGLLTQASFLAAHGAPGGSHPVKRGVQIVERFLCLTLPPPPAEVPDPRPESPSLSTRDRFEEHSRNECARACHSVIDPPGFAFEHYDGIGAYRAKDGGKPVDASGAFDFGTGQPQPFRDAIELARLLAQGDLARSCAVSQWLRYALARKETGADALSSRQAKERFSASGYDVRELLVAIATGPSFLYRSLSAGEVLP